MCASTQILSLSRPPAPADLLPQVLARTALGRVDLGLMASALVDSIRAVGERTKDAWANEKAGFYYVVVRCDVEDWLHSAWDREDWLRELSAALRPSRQELG
jgi:hypothetical protein